MRIERMLQARTWTASVLPRRFSGTIPARAHRLGSTITTAVAAVAVLTLVAATAGAPDASATPRWRIEKPIVKGEATPLADAPLRKDEAAEKELEARYPVFRIDVEGRREGLHRPPGTVEQRFANVLNRGNPEVEGGEIRHGTFYDGLFYWGSDPLSFIWLNTANRLRD